MVLCSNGPASLHSANAPDAAIILRAPAFFNMWEHDPIADPIVMTSLTAIPYHRFFSGPSD